MSKQIENKYDTAKKMYPILKNYPYNIVETLDENSPYYLEHFPPEEVGSLENPRPKNLPIGEYGLQIFKDVRPEDIAGDIISHHIINKDKYLSKKYEEFKKLISKEDMLNRYNYHKNNLGENRDFNNWSERTGYPELLRGYVFNQFDKKTKDNLYTLEQKKVLDSIKNYITQNEQTQKTFNKGGTTMEQQMSGLVRRPIKAHKGTIVDGQIVYEKDDVESTTSPPKESAPVATPTTTEPAPAVSTPALAVTPPPPPVPTTQQPVQQTVQQPAPQPIPPPPPPPQPVVQPVETPEQAQQVASTFVPENVKTAPKQATPFQALQAVDESKLTDAQKTFIKNNSDAAKNFLAKKQQQESAKRLQQAIATQPTPKRLPQPYRPTQEERFELNNLNNIVMSSPEFKLLQKESREFIKIQQKELGSYQRKVNDALRQFGPQSQEFKNALESMQFQNRLFVKQYAPTMQRLNKLQSDLNNSDAVKNFNEARDKIFNKKQINTSVPSQFNKGGMSMEQQMSLFEEGGMKDDGLDRDPVSGNEIPPGSLAKEVRDDIPAQLSDGEYVVPADVVQYYGVKFFEDLRAEAKRGLAEMEATGRIGGEPVEVDMTMIAFGQRDEDKKEKKATGGVVGFDNGGVSSDMQQIEKSRTFNPADYAVPGFTPSSPIYQTGQGQPQSQQNKTTMTYYHGQTGEAKVVTFINGVVTPASDLKFTQPPWSLNKPTQTQQQVSKDRDDKKTPPPGWGADPEKFDFTDWTAENWNKEVDSLLDPDKNFNGFFRAAGVANAYAAIELAKAKGIDTSKMEEKVKDAYDDLGVFGKVIVTGTNKLLNFGGEGAYAETISRTNPSYANLDSTTKAPINIKKKETNQEAIDRLKKQAAERRSKDSAEDRRQRKADIERATKKSVAEATTDDASKAAKKKGGGTAKISTGEMIKADEQTGFESRFYNNKGGLLQRPKRKNKK